MIPDTSTLPDDPAELKKIIAKMAAEKESLRKRFETENELLREELRLAYAKFFGPKSEVFRGLNPQLPLFDMPEPEALEKEPEDEHVEIAAHSRKQKGRKPLPEELPRVEVVHDIPEEEKVCQCGAHLSRIGEEICEKLDLIPAVIRVIKHIRPKYSCKSCEGVEDERATVRIAPVPPQIIPKGIASSGLLAHILTAKFEDGLPFYRQEKQFNRLGVELGRATMCNWAMKAAKHCTPLLELLKSEVLSGPLINADETTVQVLAEPGRSPTTQSYMWLFRGGDPFSPAVIYNYHPSRSGDVAHTFLRGYQGAVQTDGYSGYNFLDVQKEVTHIGCWAHARRKFMEADKARPKKGKPGSTMVALNAIQTLYRVEKKAKKLGLKDQDLVELRRKESLPVLQEFKTWLEKRTLSVTPQSLLGKAVSYTLKQWHRLVAYVDVAAATPDNNLAENAIRPFVVGRKNWLFAGTPQGAQASAAIYSLIETAKANGLDVYKYIRFLFDNLPMASTAEDYRRLLPNVVSEKQISQFSSYSVV
jgi:transposase